ncbi:MAG: hypothetical protein WA945_08695, partial [Arcobacteraceae bacterium]
VSPDYAVIAQKDASCEIIDQFDEIFNKDFGLSLHCLTSKFESRLVRLEEKATQAQEKATEAQKKATQAQDEVIQLNENYTALLLSNSWKITKPLRDFKKFLKWFKVGIISWIRFAPNSRPRRVLVKILMKLKNYIVAHPKLKRFVIQLLNRFPKLRRKLLEIQNPKESVPHITELSIRANGIYTQLRNLQKKHKDS